MRATASAAGVAVAARPSRVEGREVDEVDQHVDGSRRAGPGDERARQGPSRGRGSPRRRCWRSASRRRRRGSARGPPRRRRTSPAGASRRARSRGGRRATGASQRPPRIRTARAAIFSTTSTFSRRLPGFTPAVLTSATMAMAPTAQGLGFAARRRRSSRSVYCAKVMATAAMPPPWIITSDAQPKRKPTSGW